MFTSTKRFGPISTGHRQWKHDGHCSYVHGYGRIVEITFQSKELDCRGWVMDFGNLKEVKNWFDEEWDHRVLLAYNDPLLNEFKYLADLGGIDINILPKKYGPGIEQSCKYVFDETTPIIKRLTSNRVWISKVKIFEHENNWAEYNVKNK
jgi:6-pyruvoyltetrahydropterin/6-carboxytetrahydropterin synthase